MRSTDVILNNSITELYSKRKSLQREIDRIDAAVLSINSILSHYNNKIETKTNFKKKSRNSKKVSEESVRDAIISIIKSPPEGNKTYKPAPGYFTSSYIIDRLGIKFFPVNLLPILEKFVDKGMLESKPYKRGKQYRYIQPINIPIKQLDNIVSKPILSDPVSGTGNNANRFRDKDIEKLVNKAKTQGFIISHTGSGHIRVSTSDLKKFATISKTTNKPLHVTVIEAELKKIGVIL